jgi:hypothetical protein
LEVRCIGQSNYGRIENAVWRIKSATMCEKSWNQSRDKNTKVPYVCGGKVFGNGSFDIMKERLEADRW